MIGKQLKLLRELKQKSQSEVCAALCIEQSTLANYENDKRVPKIDMLIKLAEYYNVTVDVLIGNKKMNSDKNCDYYFYEEGSTNWAIRKKAEDLNIEYDDVLKRTGIPKERFDLLWFGNAQPYAEELIRFSTVLDVSSDFLLDISQHERYTSDEDLILKYYHKHETEIMDLLGSFDTLSKIDRTILLGKCYELEKNSNTTSSVAEDVPLREAK